MSTYEFDATYSAKSGLYLHDPFPPDVSLSDPDVDVTAPWKVITGKTGQYSYDGAVMHPSENADDETVRQWVLDAGGDVFAIVEVRDEDGALPDGDPIGWAVVYLPEGVRA